MPVADDRNNNAKRARTDAISMNTAMDGNATGRSEKLMESVNRLQEGILYSLLIIS